MWDKKFPVECLGCGYRMLLTGREINEMVSEDEKP
jgi:Zn ribbon nucleic-acid-binding protein